MNRVLALSLSLGAACVGVSGSGPARADYIDHFATRTDVGLYKVPSQGETRVLVIPVIIDDLPFAEGDEQQFLDEVAAFYADDDVSVFDGGFRFSPWWRQQSLGRFDPKVTVSLPVRFATCPPLGAYEGCAIPRGAGIPEGDLQGGVAVLVDALKFMDDIFRCASDGPPAGGGAANDCTAGGGVDFASFDVAGNQPGVADGFVDGVILISNAGFPGIALPVKDLATRPLLSFLGPFPEFVYDGVTVPSVAIAGRTQRPGRETFVSVHEFGHLLGFADLYNEAGTTTDLPYTLMGGWYYDTPASLLDPFSRVAIGWANVIQVSGPGTFALPTAATSGVVLKVGDGDEFFLIEHRQKVGDALDADLGIPSGVLVERVRLQKRPDPAPGSYFETLQNCVNCTAFDPMLMVEEADGAYDLQRGRARDDSSALFQSGDSVGPSDNEALRSITNPVFSTNLLDGTPTGLTITVTDSADASAVVSVDAPALADPCASLGALCVGTCDVDAAGDGRCGDFEEFGFIDGGDGPDDNNIDDVGGLVCGCAGSRGAGDGVALALVGGVLLVARRRRR